MPCEKLMTEAVYRIDKHTLLKHTLYHDQGTHVVRSYRTGDPVPADGASAGIQRAITFKGWRFQVEHGELSLPGGRAVTLSQERDSS